MAMLTNYVSYISGARFFFPEITVKWAYRGYLISYNKGYHENPLDQKRFKIERDFYDFIRTRKRPEGPVVRLGFVQGNLDGWTGWDGQTLAYPFKEGYFLPPLLSSVWNKWRSDVPEAGWRYLDVVLPGIQFVFRYPVIYPTKRQHWFTGTPYGKVDLVPSEAPLEVLKKYKALVFLAWNTITPNQYRKLKSYVENGGTLFMALPHLSTHTEREGDIKLFNDGDFQDLFGVQVRGKGEEINTIVYIDQSSSEDYSFPVHKSYQLKGHERNRIYVANIKNKSAKVLAVDKENGRPVLIENHLGKGWAYLLNLWNYPGEEKLSEFMRDLVRTIAEGCRGEVRISGSENVNFAVYTQDGKWGVDAKPGIVPTTIYLVNIDWWTLDKEEEPCILHLRDHSFPLKLKRADVKAITWLRNLAISPDDKMVYIETIEEEDNEYKIVVQGSGQQAMEVYVLEGVPESVQLNGKTIKYEYDKKRKIIRFECSLSGRDVIHIVLR